MSMNSPESIPNIARDIWKNNRPLAIALIAGAIGAGYLLYKKQGPVSAIAPITPAPMATTGPGGTFHTVYETVTLTNPTATPVPTPVTTPVPTPVPVIMPPSPVPTPGPVPNGGRPAWLPAIPNGSRLIQNWGGLPWGWQAPGSKIINGLNPPPGTKIWQGSAGRWWYAVPGGQQSLLTIN